MRGHDETEAAVGGGAWDRLHGAILTGDDASDRSFRLLPFSCRN
jgi:hypothetical protein